MPTIRNASRPKTRRRRYDMRHRGQRAATTRAAIVAAAHDLLDDREVGGLTLDEVARAARVSRATIYNQFGSRRRLLAAVFEDQGRRIGYDRVLAAMRLEDPRAAVIGAVRESCRAWGSCPLALRRTLALAVIDPEIGGLVQRYEQYRRGEFAALARRLGERGALGAGRSPEDAAAMLAALTSFQAFDLLSADSDAEVVADRLARMAVTSLGLHPYPEPESS